MRIGLKLILLCVGLLCGCGGGSSSVGGGGGEEQTQPFLLGLLRADVPSTLPLTVMKPLYRAGTFELAAPPVGPFAPLPDSLPMPAGDGPDTRLWVVFTPPAVRTSDAQEGTIRLIFRADGWDAIPVTLQLKAEVETPSASFLQTQVSAGNVIVGESASFGVYVANTSVATPVTVNEATIDEGDFSFAPDAYALPAVVGAGSRLFLRLEYAPKILGPSSSFLRVRHSASDQPLEATVTGTGVEQPSARLVETAVSAGKVVVGEALEIGVEFENTSAMTTVQVTGMTLPEGEFAIAPGAPALPANVAPGATLRLPVLYAPQGVWDSASSVQIHHTAATEPLEATLSGTGIPARLVTYFDVALDTGSWTFESDWQYIDVPAEAVSMFLEATGDPYSVIDLIGLEGPSGTVYENYDMTGPLDWLSNYPAGGRGYLNVALPNSDAAAVQLESGGGTYRFRLRDSGGWTDKLQVRVTVVQRTTATVEEGTLDLRVFLADGLQIDPYYAMSDTKLADLLKTLDALLGEDGIRLGNISFVLMDPYYDWLWGEWMAEDMIVTNTAGYSEGALNLFLVTEMDYGTASVAGAVPGPTANGTPFSGVVLDWNEADGISLGAIGVHQIVHYLGTETEEVVPSQDEIYPALRHPLLNPGVPQDLLSPPESTDYGKIDETIGELPPMDKWCGTCTRPPVR